IMPTNPFGPTGAGPGGTGTGSTSTVVFNNDNSANAALQGNIVSLSMTFNASGPIDYFFPVFASTGTTEYFYGNLIFNNQSGVTWTDFHFQIMTVAAGLDFDTGIPGTGTSPGTEKDPTPTSTKFTVLNHQPTFIDWSGGTVVTGDSAGFTFSIDVPDVPSGFI